MAKVGSYAPTIFGSAVINGEIVEKFHLDLPQYRDKYVVVLFYPADFTFVCPTELIAFSDRIEEFRKINAEVVAISMDSKFVHLAWDKTPRREGGLGGIKIPLVSDFNKEMSKSYGVINEFGEDSGVPLRGMFILSNCNNQRGSERVVRQITINDLPVGRSVDEALRLVQAFQYSDENPDQGCPVNWVPGKATIKTDSVNSKEFFGAQYSN